MSPLNPAYVSAHNSHSSLTRSAALVRFHGNGTPQPPLLPTGPTELKFNFIKTGEFAGIDELYVAGQKVGEVDMPFMHISTYSLAETFDIGRDTGTQVGPAYEGGPFPFTGQIDRVVINLTNAGERSQEPPYEFVD